MRRRPDPLLRESLRDIKPEDGDHVVFVYPASNVPSSARFYDVCDAAGDVAEELGIRFGKDVTLDPSETVATERWRIVRRAG